MRSPSRPAFADMVRDLAASTLTRITEQGPAVCDYCGVSTSVTKRRVGCPEVSGHLDAFDEVVRLLADWLDENAQPLP